MLDTSVSSPLMVFFQVTFCVMMAKENYRRKTFEGAGSNLYGGLGFPGLLIFPVLFALLVEIIFAFPGNDFSHSRVGYRGLHNYGCFITLIYSYKFPVTLKETSGGHRICGVNTIAAIPRNNRNCKRTHSRQRHLTMSEMGCLAGFLLIMAAGAVAGILIHKRSTRKNNLKKCNRSFITRNILQ